MMIDFQSETAVFKMLVCKILKLEVTNCNEVLQVDTFGVLLRLTKFCIYNQFSVAFILHSIKAYFFTCSYFRILYSVLHLKDSSTSIRVKVR